MFLTAFLTDFNGCTAELPILLSWDIRHGLGNPCDAFDVSFIYNPSILKLLSDATRFKAVYNDETVFFGVVDDFTVSADDAGMIATVSGRGMGALLLDNESVPAEYFYASLPFILDHHVYPWGIDQVKTSDIPTCTVFTVSAGSSQWKILEDFVWFSGGIRPRFSRDGILLLDNSPGKNLLVDKNTAVFSQKYTEQRYGVISSVLVNNKALNISSIVENQEFSARGGNCRRVVSVPRNTFYDVMRHTGNYQLERSREEQLVLEISLLQPFAAFPGDTLTIEDSPLGVCGSFLVSESRCWANKNGGGTVLTLLNSQL